MAELRRDPLSGNWVVVGYTKSKSDDVSICPFCPQNEELTPHAIREYRDFEGKWEVRCFPASNPVFVIEVSEAKRAEGLYDKMGNVGAHEIVVESRMHTKTLSAFEEGEFLPVVDMFIDRIVDLKKDKRFKYVQIFRNHGELAGSYIFHPHSHVLATPIMPHRLELELANSKSHFLQKERCLLCDIVSQEMRQDKRVIETSTNFLAFCPFASRFPFEVWMVPRFHNDSFESLHDVNVKREFVSLFLDIMRRIEKVTNSYTMAIHSSPNTLKEPSGGEEANVSDYFHWHIEILPRDFRTSKYKREDEFYTAPIVPEEAATLLKGE